MAHYFKRLSSPVGMLRLIACEDDLAYVLWETNGPGRMPESESIRDDRHPVLLETERQLTEYFGKKRKSFDLPLNFSGSDFQMQVWTALLTIPFGETRTYGDIARQIGKPDAVRAVGGATNRNPIAIIAPCHRVIGGTGKLIGFGGGLENKSILFQLERSLQAPTLF